MRTVLPGLTLVIASLFLPACSKQPESKPVKPTPTFDDVKKMSGEAFKTLGEFTADKMQRLKKDLLVKLNEMDAKVDELENRIVAETGPQQEKAREKLKELGKKIEDARKKVGSINFNASTSESWEKIKQAADTIVIDLGKTYKEVVEILKQ